MEKKLVIFDFDGVIVNTHDVSFELNQRTNPHLTREMYSKMSHGNFYNSFEEVKFVPNPDFFEHYQKEIVTIDPPKGIKDAIKKFNEKYLLAIVSSAHTKSLVLYLEKENLASYFGDLLGADMERSKVIKLKQLLDKYSVNHKDAVFITDTLGDVLEAHEVGIKSIGVLWGLHDEETLLQGNPELIITEPNELEAAVERILNSSGH